VNDAHDLRAIGPRLISLLIAVVLGFPAALGITLILPTRDHFPDYDCGFSHPEQGHIVTGGDPVLMFAGGVVISLALHALISSRLRARR